MAEQQKKSNGGLQVSLTSPFKGESVKASAKSNGQVSTVTLQVKIDRKTAKPEELENFELIKKAVEWAKGREELAGLKTTYRPFAVLVAAMQGNK